MFEKVAESLLRVISTPSRLKHQRPPMDRSKADEALVEICNKLTLVICCCQRQLVLPSLFFRRYSKYGTRSVDFLHYVCRKLIYHTPYVFGRGTHFFIGAMVHTDPVFKNPTKMTSWYISIPKLKLWS